MSILDTLKPKAGAKPPTAPEIEQQVKAQRERVIELETAIGQAALDALTGDHAAVERHRKVKADLLEAHDRLALLNAAHAGAIERDKVELETKRAAIRETQRQACKRHLKALADDADAFQASLETTVKLYLQTLDHSSKALAATPIGLKLPDDTIAPGKLRQFVMAELFRQSAPATGGSIGRDSLKLFPGASSPDIHFDDQPEKIPAFADQVRKEIDQFKRAIDGKAE